jgi:thiol:disulfide interchange protein DsbD
MPFGLVFGALFFGGLCTWIGLGHVATGPLPMRLTGLFLALSGLALALSLLQRRRWARWTGAGVATLLVVFGFRQAMADGRVIDHLLLLAAAATVVLLALPARGPVEPPAPRRRGPLELATTVGLCGLALSAVWAGRTGPAPGAQAEARPIASIATRVEWSDFAPGLERARREGKLVLATFVTDWCPYCKKMDQKTWRAPSVAERLVDVVPVRVDAEEDAGGRFSGRKLAARYQVRGYPATVLIDADGAVLSRSDGYRTASQILRWLDTAIPAAGRRATSIRQTAFR